MHTKELPVVKREKNTKTKKTKVLFILPSLTPGGAERVFSFISQNLNKNDYSSTLLVTGIAQDNGYTVNKIPVHYLGKTRVLNAIPSIAIFLMRNKPKIVFSSLAHLNMVMGLMSPLFINTKFVIRPTNIAPKDQGNWLTKLSFSWVDAVICQSKDMGQNFMDLHKTSEKKITIIGNPITTTHEDLDNSEISVKNNFITVGRLNNIKGHARIIRILSKLESDFHYTIVGDGPEKENLTRLINELGLTEKVTHIPHTSKVNEYLSKSSMFLQGSYSEGFPNAALESCVMGIPVLAFNVPGGTKEIIENNINGFLVDTEEEFLEGMRIEKVWNKYSIRQSVTEKFSSETILKRYEALCTKIIND